ncbi:hypothetical protein Rctr197k_043 [Virus Rctr197k]|nr:hypothetical protein Rctr197k_043 [Virus Rctr197k]
MDLMAAVQEFNSSPERLRARQARRNIRDRVLYQRIAAALGRSSGRVTSEQAMLDELDALAKFAAGWNLSKEDAIQEGAPLGNQHPGAAAILIVRQVLGEYDLPTEVDLRYHGIKRASGHGAYSVDEGIVYVQATLRSISGPRHHIDIPVIIREGRVLAPSILLHQGTPRILTQHTFDDIIGMGEFTAKAPDRPNMYAPPPDKDASSPQREVPRLAPNMFRPLPSRAIISSAVRGYHTTDTCPACGGSGEVEDERGPLTCPTCGGYGTLPEEEPPMPGMDQDADGAVLRRTLEPTPGKGQPASYGQDFAEKTKLHYTPDAEEELAMKLLQQRRRLKTRPKRSDELNMTAGAHEEWVIEMVSEQIARETAAIIREGHMGQEHANEYMLTKAERIVHKRDLAEKIVQAAQPLLTEALGAGPGGGCMGGNCSHQHHAFYEPDVTGVLENGSLGRDVPGANGSHLDVAERPTKGMFGPGTAVRLKHEATARDRGGVVYMLPKGSRGQVVRDVDGAGRAYYVRFAELGITATVPKEALSA